MTVFYCDLDERILRVASTPKAFAVERVSALTELSKEHLEEMTSFWNRKLANRNIRKRFEKGASLWMVKCDDRLAGYGWTLQGGTIEPYFFPLMQNDVHFFDFHVFPRYRGRGVNPYLVGQILDCFATNCRGRAFIEAAEWNNAQLSSLQKTSFRCLGSVRSFTILGHKWVSWIGNDAAVRRIHKPADSTVQISKTARSNEQ
jgi:hypothetical protein